MDVVREPQAPAAWLHPTVRVSQRKHPLPLSLALIDAVSILAALALAYWARYHVAIGPDPRSSLPFTDYQKVAIPLLGITLAVLSAKGAYRRRLSMEVVHEVVLVASASTISAAVVIVLTFMLHQFEYSRGVLIYLWILLIVLLILSRVIFRFVQIARYRRGRGVRNLLVIGASDVGKMIMQTVTNRPDTGYRVIGFVDRRNPERVPDFGRFRRVGDMANLAEILDAQDVDEVLLALPGSAHEEAASIIDMCNEAGVGLKLVPDLFRVRISQVAIDDLGGIPLLHVSDIPARRVERTVKRLIDLAVGLTVAAVSVPVIGILAILIKLDSPGGVFVRQERVGYNGRIFSCLKLRTMQENADQLIVALEELNEAQGPIFKMRNDPRLTRVGRYIRRFSLDELPQIWNVVRGEMSLVGPRPPLPREVVQYEMWQLRRLETTPGMTGLWQVSGRSNLNFDEMVMMDIMYIDNWTLALDLKILLQTLKVVVLARGAY